MDDDELRIDPDRSPYDENGNPKPLTVSPAVNTTGPVTVNRRRPGALKVARKPSR